MNFEKKKRKKKDLKTTKMTHKDGAIELVDGEEGVVEEVNPVPSGVL